MTISKSIISHECTKQHHMDTAIRDRFTTAWQKYCPGAELPVTFEISDEYNITEQAKPPKGWRCIICDLARVRRGKSLVFDRSSVTCNGGLFYLGYDTQRTEHFRYFLSQGKPGVVEGERYKNTPEIVDEMDARHESPHLPGKYYTFKRWDMLTETDNPDVVIFFARPEVLSCLFTLANFDRAEPNGVIAPFGSGCSSIVHYPRLEQKSDHPRAVIGMFDPSARSCVPVDVLSFAMPMKRFLMLIDYMDESFLVTKTWNKVQNKILRSNTLHSQ